VLAADGCDDRDVGANQAGVPGHLAAPVNCDLDHVAAAPRRDPQERPGDEGTGVPAFVSFDGEPQGGGDRSRRRRLPERADNGDNPGSADHRTTVREREGGESADPIARAPRAEGASVRALFAEGPGSSATFGSWETW